MPDTRNVALYVRVVHEDGDAVAMQEAMLRKYAEEHGYANISVYVDNGFNGIRHDRPAFIRLNEDIAAGLICKVLVRDISRITRNSFEIPEWIRKIQRHGVTFVSVADGVTEETFGRDDGLYHWLANIIPKKPSVNQI